MKECFLYPVLERSCIGPDNGLEKKPVCIPAFLALNDEHQGEGGTLVFVAVYVTTALYIWQEKSR